MLLPSLNGLRAFEAAARHMSFTRAAAELNVTQTAISHQIRRLEEQLGLTLFIRRNRTLELTREAQDYLPSIRSAFADLHRATARLRRTDHEGAADRQHHRLARDQMAGVARGGLSGRQSGHRGADHDLHPPGRFPARGGRHRRPLWPRRVARPARRLADGGADLSGVRPAICCTTAGRFARPRTSRTTRCCTPPSRGRTGSFG